MYRPVASLLQHTARMKWKWRWLSVGADHMLSEKSQWTQNGTMFVDLDWPLNASSPLSASAELLVDTSYILVDVKLAELANNSFESKMWHFRGSKHTMTLLLHILRRGQDPSPILRIYAPGSFFCCFHHTRLLVTSWRKVTKPLVSSLMPQLPIPSVSEAHLTQHAEWPPPYRMSSVSDRDVVKWLGRNNHATLYTLNSPTRSFLVELRWENFKVTLEKIVANVSTAVIKRSCRIDIDLNFQLVYMYLSA